ncbi:uncharacterized protein LOC131003862 isoform X2 [Salvia miltiorrhiza]|uniref:uncharacterized protein LOC131003862 isoform X2 n=1 Tax=Salvia miltiorrhiza TaxID=226208 RepID=UPI0025ABBCF6|nr:uncharacterized protein LOC131003862 isoform X2 [Salvia miltiorrhiza]
MACHAVQVWSLSGLVAAFLDLTIAYLLLCASAAAYFASKFLGFFGLNLPCPCDGMFINVHSRSLCFNKLLVDFPIQKLSDVQLSVRQKFPFSNSVSSRKYDYSVVGDNCGIGIIELEGDASCSSSISDVRESADVVRREMSSRSGKIDMKGKGVLGYRPKSRLRSRKGVSGHGKNSSLLSYDSPVFEEVSDSQLHHFNTNKRGSWSTGDGSLPTDNAGNLNFEYDKAPKKMRGRIRTLSRDEMDLSPDEDMHIKESMLSGEDRQYNQQEVQSCGGYENTKIRQLEQALERERAARASLYIELEKERSAAASAADEAMAMILRLQKDKASVEMEARQYQRIIEEKSAYDDEEMDILQEILMRREKEKLFLEKEVEAYKEIVSRGNEQSTGDYSDSNDATQIFSPLNDPNDDPVLFQHQLAASTDEKVKMENKWADDVFASRFKCKPAFGIESPFQPHDEQSSVERLRNLNENSVDVSVRSSSGKMDLPKEVISSDENIQLMPKAIPSLTEELEEIQEWNQEHKIADKVIRTCYGTEKGDLNYNPSLKQQTKEVPLGYCSSCDPTLEKVPHDVHVIRDGINLHSKATADKGEQLPVSSSLKVREIDCVQSGAALESINDSFVKKSSSEVPSSLPPIGRRSQSLRRSSMSALDTEMLKIDSEIVQLQERLKLVQEGREKLSVSLENRESKSLQLKILEDIARQIQEIRRLTEPQKAARQASLPLPNSKGLSKRRRSRSVSSGFQMSSEG